MREHNATEQRVNEFGQPIGAELAGWEPCPFPDVATIRGRWCRIEPLLAEHADELFDELERADDSLWTYLSVGPFADRAAFVDTVEGWAESRDAVSVLVRDATGAAGGVAHLMNIRREHGVVEIGGLALAPRMQRTVAATEAQFLLARHVFSLGYRRYEWKCDALNEPSRRAAQRLGFTYEGCFRQAVVYKGRSRDTAWFAMTDTDWAALAPAYAEWLDPANQPGGRQLRSLAQLTTGDL